MSALIFFTANDKPKGKAETPESIAGSQERGEWELRRRALHNSFGIPLSLLMLLLVVTIILLCNAAGFHSS